MKQPIIDKAEISIDFPEKFYAGSFGRESTVDLRFDDVGLHLTLEHRGEPKRRVGIHLHHYLLGEILTALAEEVRLATNIHPDRRRALHEAARELADAAVPGD
jgi:hypothetical protein